MTGGLVHTIAATVGVEYTSHMLCGTRVLFVTLLVYAAFGHICPVALAGAFPSQSSLAAPTIASSHAANACPMVDAASITQMSSEHFNHAPCADGHCYFAMGDDAAGLVSLSFPFAPSSAPASPPLFALAPRAVHFAVHELDHPPLSPPPVSAVLRL